MLLRCIIGQHCDCCWPNGDDCCECDALNTFQDDDMDFLDVGVDRPIALIDDDIEWDDDGTDENVE